MAKHKYIVETPHGTFTRTTHRTYTHIVVIKQKNLQYIERKRQENIAWYKEQYQPGPTLDWYINNENQKADNALSRSRAGHDAQVAGWAGRLDLAQKVAKSVEKNFGVHDIVEIYPVPQEVVA